ncbi:hypothetical protein [Zavarzinella formosa]|uniref:hypothetical protein n=1 Tax=Zavarzinella formosa TaxID=360055 RepID=UPI0002E53FA7|nr:hypothetical protein [Zavarzinella formosa]
MSQTIQIHITLEDDGRMVSSASSSSDSRDAVNPAGAGKPITPNYPPPPGGPAPTGSPGGNTSYPNKTQILGVNFPTTVIGPDGKVYSMEAFEAARQRVERDKFNEDADAAYEAFKPKDNKPKKIGPDTVDINGEKMSMEAHATATKRIEADKAYKALNPDSSSGKQSSGELEAPGKKPPPLPGEKIKAQAEGNVLNMIPGAGKVMDSAKMIQGGAMQMGGMAALGAVLPIASVAAQQLTTSFQNMKKNVDAVGDSLVTFAGNERQGVGQLMDGAVQAIRAPTESLPIVGDMIKAQNELYDSIANLPSKLTAAFIQQGQKLAPYSGAIQGANAKAEVREITADIREAQQMGDSYAKMIDAQSRLDDSFREFLFPIKKFLVDVLAERLKFMADALDVIVNLPGILNIIIEQGSDYLFLKIIEWWSGKGDEASRSIRMIPGLIKDLIEQSKPNQNVDLFDQFFKDVARVKFDGNAFAQ